MAASGRQEPIGGGEMPRMSVSLLLPFSLMLVITSCAPGASPGSSVPAAQPAAGARKQIMAGILSQPAGLFQELTNPTGAPSSIPGLQETYQLVNGTLTYTDLASD